MKYANGYFNEDGTEFITTNPATKRAFDNFMWNEAIFSNVQQTGVGYADYQVGGLEGIQLLTGIGRICDFDVFGRDHLMSRLIYIRDNDTGEYWNVNWEPVQKEYDAYECVHGLGYSVIRTVVSGIRAEFRIFVPKGKDPVELWTLKLTNVSDTRRNLSVFVYNQFQFAFKWGFDSYGDTFFRNSLWDKERNAVVATKHPHRRPHNYLTGFLTADRTIEAFDGNKESFVGVYNTLREPDAVVKGQCSNTPGSSDATVGAAQFNLELAAGAGETISLMLGATDRAEGVTELRDKYLGHFETYFEELRKEKQELVNRNAMYTPDGHYNRILNYWVKQASLFGAAWCRWGWNGYRDIVQHGYGVAALQPERTKDIILEALQYQYKSGLALRGWNPVDEKPYSDSALWLVFTLIAYLEESGDFGLLEQRVPFYDGDDGTVLEHIERALDFLETNKGAHELCLIKYGDWNDSLTAVGKNGKGESVWLSIAYAEAVRQMEGLFRYSGLVDKAEEYAGRRSRIAEAVNGNAWNGKWYTRCYDDEGRAIGTEENKYAQIFMEPQCWALIAGLADEERTEQLLESCKDKLMTDVGYLLLAPTFMEIDENIGRISSMEPGICENGTVYSHLNIWMIKGLLRSGRADEAYELFRRVTPGYAEVGGAIKDYNPPYMYANCYYGPDHRNNAFQMEYTWVTGSVAWFNRVLMDDMLGARAEFGGLRIDPCLPSDWKECRVHRSYRGADYDILIENPHGLQKGAVTLTVDGVQLDGDLIPVHADGKLHNVVAVIQPA